MTGLTVIICCYNSAKRLPETLKYLASQQGLENIPWEVVVVNNNSTDNTVWVAKQEWQKYDCGVQMRVLDEPVPGLSAARERGIHEAQYEYLVFCDDDNSLFPDYIRLVWDTFTSNDEIGLVGGEGIAVCEGSKPEWFDDLQIMYAVGPQYFRAGDITNTGAALYGAGMGLRKEVFLKLKEKNFNFILSDRKGKSLSSGGDTELCFASILLGYKMYYNPEMKFYHNIPKERLTKAYVKRLSRAMLKATTLIRPYIYAALDTKETRVKYLWLYEIAKACYEYLLSVKSHKWVALKNIHLLFARVYLLARLNKKYDRLLHSIKVKFILLLPTT